ncbi:dnaJ homolog subfamily C member 27 isoform X3 [Rhipicephalus microplus]|uniref:dnaJ homolog subfamily C member 27 isoform X3 n=1 Tax=Rhipicephalus microplus TaxID=6941 RepID=UPI003F6C1336
MDIESRIKRPRHVRIITVGNVEAGKTSIIKRYCEGRFSVKYHATIGVDYGKTNDSSSSGERAEALERWLHEMAEGMDNTSVVCVVCGNKSDRRARVQNKDVERWVDMHKFSHFVVSALNGIGIREMFQSLLMQVLKVQETGRDPIALWSSCNYSKEELQAVHQVRWSRSEYEKLGLDQRASKDDINRSYRRLAVLLHPDKSTAPGCEEAFKMLVAARTALLKRVVH